MTVSPTFGWTSIGCAGHYNWSEQFIEGGAPNAPIAIPANTPIHFSVNTAGAVSFTVTADLTAGSNEVLGFSSMTDLVEGQLISGPSIPSNTWIDQVLSGVGVLLGTFPINEVTGAVPGSLATETLTGATLTISDPAPTGTMAVIVSPSTGVTISDQNSDAEAADVSHLGNGSAICNLMGEAEGVFELIFADTGTFTVDCTFTTSDPNYASLTLTPSLTIVVS